MEPEVKFHSIGIISSDFGEINTPLPISEDQSKQILFTLHEGSEYQLKLTFSVLHNILSGLTYTNTVWKAGIQGLEPNSTSFSISWPPIANLLSKKYLMLIMRIIFLVDVHLLNHRIHSSIWNSIWHFYTTTHFDWNCSWSKQGNARHIRSTKGPIRAHLRGRDYAIWGACTRRVHG